MFVREMFGAVLDRNFIQLHLDKCQFRVGETICAEQAGMYAHMADAHLSC